jgi:heat shock protein HtpX
MQHLKAAALLSGPVLLFSLPVLLLDGGGLGWWIAVFLTAAAMVMFWRCDTLVLQSLRAEQVEEQAAPGLWAIIRRLAVRQRVRLPRVYLIDDPSPNALLITNGAGVSHLLLTAGLLQLLDSRQLAAVIAHHLSLIGNAAAFCMTMAAAYGLVLERVPGLRQLLFTLLRLIAPAALRFRADIDSAHVIGDSSPLLEALHKICAAGPVRSPKALNHLFFCPPGESRSAVEERLSRAMSLSLRPLPSALL